MSIPTRVLQTARRSLFPTTIVIKDVGNGDKEGGGLQFVRLFGRFSHDFGKYIQCDVLKDALLQVPISMSGHFGDKFFLELLFASFKISVFMIDMTPADGTIVKSKCR